MSVKIPVALNLSVSPFALEAAAGVIWISTSFAAVTDNVETGLLTFPNVALISVVPVAAP
nr:hypothetical protein [Leptospira sp. severe_002]